jgi:hypothetical protein
MLLPLIPGTLPPGVCYADEQARLNAYMAVSNASLEAGQSFYNFGPDKPAVSLQVYPWLRTTDGRWYVFSGVWRSPVNGSTFERRLFVGSLTDLQTYDGGDTGTPSTESGPMWEEDPDFRGRSPMGPGAIPSSDPALTIGVGQDLGAASHVQTTAEMAPHTHQLEAVTNDDGGGLLAASNGLPPAAFSVTTTSAGGGTAMSLLHPVRGIYIIRRTSRTYYTVV